MSYAPTEEPIAPRRRPRGRRLVVAAVVFVGLLVAADRISLLVAERLAADAFQSSQGLATRPSVSVDGFPFLTQLAAEHFGEVNVEVTGLVVGPAHGRRVRIEHLDVTLHQLRILDGFSTVTVSSATATGMINYVDLSHALGLTLTYGGTAGGTGRVSATTTVSVAGESVSATIAAAVSGSSADGLTFRDATASANGVSLPPSILATLTTAFTQSIPFGTLPFGVRLESISATPDGLVCHLSARNLTYSRPR
jgi:hypothetical protein